MATPPTSTSGFVPLLDPAGSLLGAAITFLDVTDNKRLKDNLQQSHRELETAYEELQSTNEELETTNEELQSTVEELETTNEELQSTNEELETMNEELQSTNEELETVNEELRQRGVELNQVNVFLESILGSLRSGRDRSRHRSARPDLELQGGRPLGPPRRRGPWQELPEPRRQPARRSAPPRHPGHHPGRVSLPVPLPRSHQPPRQADSLHDLLHPDEGRRGDHRRDPHDRGRGTSPPPTSTFPPDPRTRGPDPAWPRLVGQPPPTVVRSGQPRAAVPHSRTH